MQADKLTIKSQEALSEAQSQATARGHSLIEPAHVLNALLAQPEGSTIPVLQKLGVALDPLQQSVEDALAAIPKVTGGAQPHLGANTSRMLEDAFREAQSLKDEYVSTEHLLLAIVGNHAEGRAQSSEGAGASRTTGAQDDSDF